MVAYVLLSGLFYSLCAPYAWGSVNLSQYATPLWGIEESHQGQFVLCKPPICRPHSIKHLYVAPPRMEPVVTNREQPISQPHFKKNNTRLIKNSSPPKRLKPYKKCIKFAR